MQLYDLVNDVLLTNKSASPSIGRTYVKVTSEVRAAARAIWFVYPIACDPSKMDGYLYHKMMSIRLSFV